MTAPDRRLLEHEDGTPVGPSGAPLTAEQAAIVLDRSGPLMVAANAGSGKTTVLVERFVRYVVDDGIDPRAILAITFTRRAAGELRRRIRDRFVQLGCTEHARAMEGAWITTIDGFCFRVLSAQAVLAGLDPAAAVLDAAELRPLREDAWDAALAEVLGPPGAEPPPGAATLIERFGYDGLRGIVGDLYDELRSAGASLPGLPSPPPGRPEDEALRPALEALDALLRAFGAAFTAAKRTRRGLDYADLAVGTRDLLRGRPELANAYRERLQRVMVDEFQDTNRLQLDLLDALGQEHLFLVGDRLQSIYAFRHADVGGFVQRWTSALEAGWARTLATNFRSRPEILALLNAAFGDAHDAYEPLLPGREPAPAEPPCVELLMTDAEAWKALDDGDPELVRVRAGMPKAPVAVVAEARLVAERVAALVDGGRRPGEVVVLLRAGTHMACYERALELARVPAVATQGRGWWTRRELQDLLDHLRVVGNPLDEAALLGTLSAPPAALGSDALALLAIERRRRRASLWDVAGAAAAGDGEGLLGRLPADARERLAAWRALVERERAAATWAGPAELLERMLAATGLEREVLRGPGGARRLANVRKLVRLADAFEARAGRDLRAFVDHAAAELDAGEATPDAPVDLGSSEAVRVMTIHGAKGLEFPVVVLADLGRDGRTSTPPVLVGRGAGNAQAVGLRLPSLAEKEPDVAFDYAELDAVRIAAEEEEERRVIHVALTRAEDLLVLSGTFAPAKGWGSPGVKSPALAWMGPGLFGPDGAPRPGRIRVGDTVAEVVVGAPRTGVPRLDATADAAAGGPGGREPVAAAPPATAPPPGPPPHAAPAPPATLSYSSLTDFARCGYSWYLRRELGLRARDPGPLARQVPAGRADGALRRGSLAHAVLEFADLRPGAPPPTADDVRAAAIAIGETASDADVEEQLVLAAGFLDGPLRDRAGEAAELRREVAFAVPLRAGDEMAPLLNGVVDLLAVGADGRALVVDHKTDHVPADADLEALVARDYAIQRALYALAVLSAGAREVEVAHVYLERGEHAVARYTHEDLPALEARIAAAAAPLLRGEFRVAERPWAGLCAACPGRGGLCSWPDEATGAPDPWEPAPPGTQTVLPI